MSNNTALLDFRCSYNQLTSLDVSNNTALTYLDCHNNQLTSLDLSNNTTLNILYCYSNQLTSLDVSNHTALTYLDCHNNQLTSLDVSNNTALTSLYCRYNQLTSLNVKNGKNTNFFLLVANNNPNLICIQVDNASYSTTNWTNIDSQSCFSENCVTPTFTEIGTICNGDTFVLDENSQNGISGVWSPAIDNTQTQTYIFTPNTCANTITITMTFTVNNLPTPTGETSQTFTAGQTIADLVVSGTNLVWYSDNTYSLTLSDSEELVDGTTYYVVSEVGNCKSSALAITVTQVVSRTDFDIYGFSYYPNPVNDVLYFSSNSKIENVTISNILGQQINTNLSSDNKNLDMSNLPTGNYFVKVTIEVISKIIKVVKQ